MRRMQSPHEQPRNGISQANVANSIAIPVVTVAWRLPQPTDVLTAAIPLNPTNGLIHHRKSAVQGALRTHSPTTERDGGRWLARTNGGMCVYLADGRL